MNSEHNARVEQALSGARFGRTWLRVPCPFCVDEEGADRKSSLGVSASTGYYSCFRCGSRGRLDEPPDPNAVRDEAEEARTGLEVMEPPPEFCPLWLEPYRSAVSLEPARAYLTKRGVTRKAMRELQIGACDEGYWAGRVIVPMLHPDVEGWLGWVGRIWVKSPSKRAIGRASLKYLYPSGMSRRLMWNHAALGVETDTPLLIVEGVFDALPFYPHAAAVLGTASDDQIEALIHAKRPVVFVLDGDAWEHAWSYAFRLRFDGARAGMVKLPPRVDPDEVDHDWLIAEAKKSLDADL